MPESQAHLFRDTCGGEKHTCIRYIFDKLRKKNAKNYAIRKKLRIFALSAIAEAGVLCMPRPPSPEQRVINQQLILWILKEEEKVRILRTAEV